MERRVLIELDLHADSLKQTIQAASLAPVITILTSY